MKRSLLLLPVILALATVPLRAEDDNEGNPHYMLDADGSPDLDKCGFCHDDDLSLLQPKEDTCLICHTLRQHGGSAEHARVGANVLTRTVPAAEKPDAFDLPLTDAGGIYCGTCHLFHDPNDASEPWLPQGCRPSDAPFSAAVRASVEQYRDGVAAEDVAHFVTEGTRALRKPVCDDTLCAYCHEGAKK